MASDYIYAVRGWLELSWPDEEVEGVDETAEQHAAKVARIHELLTSTATAIELADRGTPGEKRYRAGWCWPQDDLGGTEYVFFGGDVGEPAVVLNQVREVIAIDPFVDGYFSVEGEDGEQVRQWLIKSGKIYSRRTLFPDFDEEGIPQGYSSLPSS
ncbi:MAG: hypothetical protein GXY52_07055 [Chloroflexi bacterium]|nr:hypothetical protein [Chloroflexota bacterium]